MAFVRQKGKYFVAVESYREGNKVKQRTLGYLGKTPDFENDFKFVRGCIKRHSLTPVAMRQTLAMLFGIVERNEKALSRRINFRKIVTLSPEQEKQLLREERTAKKLIQAAKRALSKLMKVGTR